MNFAARAAGWKYQVDGRDEPVGREIADGAAAMTRWRGAEIGGLPTHASCGRREHCIRAAAISVYGHRGARARREPWEGSQDAARTAKKERAKMPALHHRLRGPDVRYPTSLSRGPVDTESRGNRRTPQPALTGGRQTPRDRPAARSAAVRRTCPAYPSDRRPRIGAMLSPCHSRSDRPVGQIGTFG